VLPQEGLNHVKYEIRRTGSAAELNAQSSRPWEVVVMALSKVVLE
jgi:hypothetical protein